MKKSEGWRDLLTATPALHSIHTTQRVLYGASHISQKPHSVWISATVIAANTAPDIQTATKQGHSILGLQQIWCLSNAHQT